MTWRTFAWPLFLMFCCAFAAQAQMIRVPPSLVNQPGIEPLRRPGLPEISVSLELRDGGRIVEADQFEVQLTSDAGVIATMQTVGSSNDMLGSILHIPLHPATSYSIELKLLGGGSHITQYRNKLVCLNGAFSGTWLQHISQVGQPISLIRGDRVRCHLDVYRVQPQLTLHLQTAGGVGTFLFRGGFGNSAALNDPPGYVITTVNAGSTAQGRTVRLRGAYQTVEVDIEHSANWGVLGATCIDRNAGVTGNAPDSFGQSVGSTLLILDSNVRAGADIHCTFSAALVGPILVGKVILDTGVNGGVAHDGIQNGGELGQTGVRIELTNCRGHRYAEATTGSDGGYRLSAQRVPDGQLLCLNQQPPPGFHAVSRRSENASDRQTADLHQIRLTFDMHREMEGPTMGNAPVGQLSVGARQIAGTGRAAVFRHIYQAGTRGTVEFGFVPGPLSDTMLEVLYWDPECTGALGLEALPFPPEFAVEPGERICLLVKVASLAGVAQGTAFESVLQAREIWVVPTFLVWQKESILRSVNTLDVAERALTLTKEWRRVARCPRLGSASGLDATPFALSGTALPGDLIEYRLTFSNLTDGPLRAVSLFDALPRFTQFQSAYCLPIDLAGIDTCSVRQQPAPAAGVGEISWALLDASGPISGLQPSASGAVSYCVRVEQ